MKTLRRAIISTIVIAFLLVSQFAAAQQKPPSAAQPAGLALEVTYLEGALPAFQPVGKTGGTWYGRFGRVRAWTPPEGSLPARAVKIIPRIEEGAVRIDVSIYVGAQFFDKELAVASYLLKESDKVTVEELVKFGVKPFEIAVVRVAPGNAGLPLVVDNTWSLEVVSIEHIESSLAWYKLSLRNLSDKNIAAAAIDVFAGTNLRLSGRPHGQRGAPLVEPGAVFTTKVKGVEDVLMKRYSYEPETAPAQSIVIRTLVFDDGTFEGDAEPAAQWRAGRIGYKTQLTRVVALLQESMDAADVKSGNPIEMLMGRVSALSTDVQPSLLIELSKGFPIVDQKARKSLDSSIQYSMHSVRKELLDAIQEFQKSHNQPADEKEFRSWLAATAEKYKQWLSRL